MNVFKSCGVHLDVSRDAVMTLPAIKKYITTISKMGFDTLYLYMEDMYELKDYPFFGYMRGRYTTDELKKIEAFCMENNMTVIPCIQTLGHLAQYLRYPEAGSVRDTAKELLCGAEETYRLIEAMIKTMRECFSCKKLHIGMDEAMDLGTGRYLALNGYKDKTRIFIDHLNRVCEICRKYDFIPMIWDDVAATLIKTDSEIDPKTALPDVEFVPWAYCCSTEEPIRKHLATIKQFDKPITFAGTAWTHNTMLPRYNFAKATVLPTAKAAKENGVDSFMLTIWGDDGSQTDYLFAMPQILSLAYYNSQGKFPTDDEMRKLTKEYDIIDYDFCDIAAKFDQPKGMDTDVGKRLMWGDIMLNSCRIFDKDYAQILMKAAEDIQPFIDKNDSWKPHYEYAQLCMLAASRKAYIVTNLREAYLNGDTEFLENLYANIVPELKEIYKQLELKHRILWLNTYKPFGYQKIGARYGAQIMRLDYAYERLKDYLTKKVDTLPELDEAPIRCEGDSNMAFFTEGGTIYVDYEKFTYARYLIDVAL